MAWFLRCIRTDIMKVAIPIWNDRVSPVLDTAERVLVVQIENGTEQSRETVGLAHAHPGWKARSMAQMGVDAVICGALSKHLERILTAAGIEVTPWISGQVEEVLDAYRSGKLNCESFSLPGYCPQQHRRRRRGKTGPGRGWR